MLTYPNYRISLKKSSSKQSFFDFSEVKTTAKNIKRLRSNQVEHSQLKDNSKHKQSEKNISKI